MRNVQETLLLCRTLSDTARIADLVDALTVYALAEAEASGSEEGDSDDEETASGSQELPQNYWSCIARALEQAKNLRYLNIHIADNSNAGAAWVLGKCTFQLRGFHCDLNWDNHLVSFLNKQTDLNDLYLLDYLNPSNVLTPAVEGPTTSPSPRLSSTSFPLLSTLECTFSEAAVAITPGRPITRLKTCFSRTRLDEKRAEMTELLAKVRESSRPLRALDIADSEYTTTFSMELLSLIVASRATSLELRYLGTLVLPISGREVSGDCFFHTPKLQALLTPRPYESPSKRLRFYGLLMRLPRIQCIEVEVSSWVPPPSSPPAFRALASEMRLYTPSVSRVVFVHDFDRTIVTVVDGVCRMDNDANYELLWRDT
ncbi:hypothetical protein NP233_g1059 [Leucocoprinus birnbaumii]|uniref:Uncharacterized protein n=1 Tax=Leucocoprinus birnbaumii TaxID=56174 RepID=A0AAD5YY93_9AGAR|nr:hypothetical protein NP233_g1059 [Leucocoprinus birnbaumii]